MVNCPVCDAAIDVDEDEVAEGEVLTCDECGSALNVVSINPVEVESADEEDEDEDEEDFDYDEDEEEDEDQEEDEWR
ncbi:MAG: hypothetical protein KJZ78_02575 [Bryobacteraceae bacterium]|nr:hypothetical protein [Bryobacteraceae bacterium]